MKKPDANDLPALSQTALVILALPVAAVLALAVATLDREDVAKVRRER